MNIKHLNGEIGNNGVIIGHRQRHVRTICLVIFSSFVLGAIPIIYGLRLTPASSQSRVTVPGEATLWKSLTLPIN